MSNDFEVKDGFCMIDGSSMEGGGQILRNTVSLAALLSKSIKIVNIRAKRSNPGLKAQHLEGIKLVGEICGAKIENAYVNSPQIVFSATKRFQPQAKEYKADPKTAGSIGLMIQSALPCAIFAGTEITINLKGGTNAENAPQIDYTTLVFKPIAEKFGINFDIKVERRGFFPQGGGEVNLITKPVKVLSPVTLLDRGEVVSVYSRTFVSGVLGKNVLDRISDKAEQLIREYFKEQKGVAFTFDKVQETTQTAFGTGCGIITVATTSTGCLIAGSALGAKGKLAEVVGQEAAESLISNLNHGGCVDEYLQDQLIIFMALAKGKSRVLTGPLTLHTQTSIHFSECMTGAKFSVSKGQDKSGTYIIECDGIGYENPSL